MHGWARRERREQSPSPGIGEVNGWISESASEGPQSSDAGPGRTGSGRGRRRGRTARSVAASGELEFGPLPSGTYVLTELRSGYEWKVELDGSRVLDLP